MRMYKTEAMASKRKEYMDSGPLGARLEKRKKLFRDLTDKPKSIWMLPPTKGEVEKTH